MFAHLATGYKLNKLFAHLATGYKLNKLLEVYNLWQGELTIY
jgi:hypothetical protein